MDHTLPNPTLPAQPGDPERRFWLLATGAAGGVVAVATAVPTVSTFDGPGCVFKNKPAPTNLEIPPYRCASDTRILIGDDAA